MAHELMFLLLCISISRQMRAAFLCPSANFVLKPKLNVVLLNWVIDLLSYPTLLHLTWIDWHCNRRIISFSMTHA